VRVSRAAPATYRCDVAIDSWPMSFMSMYALTPALASSVA
jgi:hypothetical protein